jgi:hypothetical protein
MKAIIRTNNDVIVEGTFESINSLLIFIEVGALTAERAEQLAKEGLNIHSNPSGKWEVSAPLRKVKEYKFVD